MYWEVGGGNRITCIVTPQDLQSQRLQAATRDTYKHYTTVTNTKRGRKEDKWTPSNRNEGDRGGGEGEWGERCLLRLGRELKWFLAVGLLGAV